DGCPGECSSDLEWGGDGGELDAECHGGPEHAHRHLDRLERQPRDVHGDGDGGHGGDDCGEQCDQPDGDGGHGGQYAAVGDREGCEQIGRASGRGSVWGGEGEGDDNGRQSDDQREWGGNGGELDAEGHGGPRPVYRVLACAERQPRDVHGDGDGGHGGDDCGEQCDEPVGHGGYGGQYAAVGDREGCE